MKTLQNHNYVTLLDFSEALPYGIVDGEKASPIGMDEKNVSIYGEGTYSAAGVCLFFRARVKYIPKHNRFANLECFDSGCLGIISIVSSGFFNLLGKRWIIPRSS